MESVTIQNPVAPPIFIALATLVVVVLLQLAGFRRPSCRQLNFPAGPKPWPIVGNFNILTSSLPHRALHELSLKYGPLMGLKLGQVRVVVASSSDMARAFLKTNDHAFASRAPVAAGKYTAYNYSDMTWSPYGPYWRQTRKIFQLGLFHPKRLASNESVLIRDEEMKSFLEGIHKCEGRPITLRNHLTDLSLNIISRMAIGKKYTQVSTKGSFNDNTKAEELKEMIDEWLFLSGVFNIGDMIPQLGFLDLQGYEKRMKILGEKFDRLLEQVLDEHSERKRILDGDFEVKDMVDLLLQLADDPNADPDLKLPRDGIKAFTVDLLVGGTDTSAIVAEWAMCELLTHPETLQKVTCELDAVIGKDRWVEENDMENLPYIDAVIKETMRVHPPAALLAHLVTEDINIAGYDIPKGTLGMVNGWALARDPKLWDTPEKFCPERFIGKEIDVRSCGQQFELMPFGSGRRMCPGNALGFKLIQTSIANILHGFTWELAGKENELNMEELDGLSSPKKTRLVVVPKPRLPIRLYH